MALLQEAKGSRECHAEKEKKNNNTNELAVVRHKNYFM